MTILQHAIAQAAAASGSYQIARSLRFNSADSAYLSRTPGSAGNRQKFTYSTWVKITSLASAIQRILGVGVTNYFGVDFGYSAGEFNINVDVGPDVSRSQNYTTATFRDPSAWYHIVIAVDTTQATAANRLKIYVNNVLYSYSSTATIPQNVSTDVNNTAAHNIGRRVDSTDRYTNTYMADIRLIDGQQLDPTSFGEFDANTGVWSPKTYSGTYGTNGFWLKLDDNSNTTAATLGKDSSGNSNNWTPNNFSVTAGVGNDSLVDSPTNYGTDTGAGGEVRGNYATLNPLDKGGDVTLVNGNLDASWSGASGHSVRSTLSITSGKWYWEVVSGGNTSVGIIKSELKIVPSSGSLWVGADGFGVGGSYAYAQDGRVVTNSTYSAYGASLASGDVLGIAFDADNGKIYFSKNGTWQNSGNPATSTNPAFTGIALNTWSPAIGYWGGSTGTTNTFNFGQRAFAYTAPSGFKALCTQNLPTPAIGATSSTLASKNMNVVTYTGNGATNSITGVGFQPDLVWIKSRSSATQTHILVDAVRGANKLMYSPLTDAEFTATNVLNSFDVDGFTAAYNSSYTAARTNENAATYVGWAFKGANTTVSNTSGSITSTVSANPTAGISLVSYTGNNTAGATVGHGLGVAPKMIIAKSRGVENWGVYHASLGSTTGLLLNSTGASIAAAWWNSAAPTSSTFSLSSGSGITNTNAQAYIAYCFAEVAGFSKFGSYTGNGSADGSFVYTGFRPRWVLIKQTSGAGGSWELFDTARNAYNEANLLLEPNSSGAEATAAGYVLDFLSNGFKLRGTGSGVNGSGATYVFAAFAEAPFQYSRAR